MEKINITLLVTEQIKTLSNERKVTLNQEVKKIREKSFGIFKTPVETTPLVTEVICTLLDKDLSVQQAEDVLSDVMTLLPLVVKVR